MLKRCFSVAVLAGLAGPAAAHPGAHVHPHDGASWLAVAGALAVAGFRAALLRQKRIGQEGRK